ncbi:MAG: Gfo/Idh/MocA family oxidoreductase [Armatimonadota bacterium]|jgi:predicted dehydrogenase
MTIDRRGFVASAAALPVMAFGAPRDGKHRVCIVGDSNCGGYGHGLHRVWAVREDVEVVAVADPDEEGRRKHAAEAGAETTYADHTEMLDKEKPDLVTIGPRTTVNHREYLLAAAAVGAHGLIEKPIATDLAEADAMVQAIEARDLKWAIGFNFRTIPAVQHAKRMILDEGIIGEVLELRSRGKEDRRAGGEDMIVLGTHSFDLMIALAGRPLWCASDIGEGDRPSGPADVRDATEELGPIVGDRVQATFGFPNGVYGHFSSVRTADGAGGRWGVDVYGTRGIVTIRLTEIPEIRLLRKSSWTTGDEDARWEPLPDAPTADTRNARAQRYAPIVHDLIAAIEEDRRPLVSLQDGRNAYEMIQAAFASHVQGSRVELPLQERAHPLKRWKATG